MNYFGRTVAALALTATSALAQYKGNVVSYDVYVVPFGQKLALKDVGNPVWISMSHTEERPVLDKKGKVKGYSFVELTDYSVDVDHNGTPDVVVQCRPDFGVEQILLNPSKTEINSGLVQRLGPKIKFYSTMHKELPMRSAQGPHT